LIRVFQEEVKNKNGKWYIKIKIKHHLISVVCANNSLIFLLLVADNVYHFIILLVGNYYMIKYVYVKQWIQIEIVCRK